MRPRSAHYRLELVASDGPGITPNRLPATQATSVKGGLFESLSADNSINGPARGVLIPNLGEKVGTTITAALPGIRIPTMTNARRGTAYGRDQFIAIGVFVPRGWVALLVRGRNLRLRGHWFRACSGC